MKIKKKQAIRILILSIVLLLSFQTTIFAHSGRTDSSGGHKDNKNASGLGSYHYHCGGHPPHLHSGGVCPYSSSSSKTSSGSTSKSTTSSSKSNSSSNTSSGSSGKNSSSKSNNSSSTSSTTSKANSTSNTEKANETTVEAKVEQSVPQTTPKEEEKNTNVDVISVKIQTPKTAELKEGESITLVALLEPSNTTNKEISWESSNTNIATITKYGRITAVSEGTVEISAIATNGLKDTISINVVPEKNEESKLSYNIKSDNSDKSPTTANNDENNAFLGAGITWLAGAGTAVGLAIKKNKK